ncbi:MAG: ferrichrome ABC transporter substrate-binding protein, partial [Ilumatobacteraceae bacterium]|nr:ferrichrome ABC transporter substrate-binding protein [Ilumatobacteraceae bacterium]
MTKRVLAITLLATLGLAACGGSSDSADTTAAPRTKNAALPARTTVPPRPA